jgi:hypothetical protein
MNIDQIEAKARKGYLLNRAILFAEQAAMNLHEVTGDKHKTASILQDMAQHIKDHG